MATFRLRHFSQPEVLGAIDPKRLLALLEPHRAYLSQRGLQFPDANTDKPLDHERLLRILLAADDQTPAQLIEALYYVDELATPEGMDTLRTAAKQRHITLDLDDSATPADVAVEVWLRCPDILEHKHGERCLRRRRSFEYYQSGRRLVPPFQMPSADELETLARQLDRWFTDNHRGTGTRIFCYQRPDGFWFLIRHGEPFKREESLRAHGTEIVFYRPIRYDIAVYQPELGELRVNARTKGERDLYRAEFGYFLRRDHNFFPGDAKYTLEPLRDDGLASLCCTDVPGMEWVKLRAVHLDRGGNHYTLDIRKASDVFASLAEESATFPAELRIAAAVFQVKFTDSKNPRLVTIRPCNLAQYARDVDAAIVEDWLERRGFVVHLYGRMETPRDVLASA